MQGGRGNQTVGRGHYASIPLRRGGQLAPDANDVAGDVENPVGVLPLQSEQPGIQFVLSRSGVEQCNPLGQFSQRDDAEVQLPVAKTQNGLANRRIASRVPNLGQHAGIQQHVQSSPTSRIGDRSRSRSMPASVGPLIRYSRKPGRWPVRRS